MPNSTIEHELDNLPSNFILSMICKRDSYSDLSRRISNYFLRKENVSGIYVTLDKPSKTIKEDLLRNKISVENLYFIDMISGVSGMKSETTNVLFSSSPSNLTELSIITNSAMKDLKTKNKFLIFDTFSTLFNYNP